MPGVHDRDVYRKMTERFLSVKWTRTDDQASALTIIPDEERGDLRSPGARNCSGLRPTRFARPHCLIMNIGPEPVPETETGHGQ